MIRTALFERITRLPEYTLTRTNNAILSSHADAIAATVAAGAAPIEFDSDQAWNGDPPRAAAPPRHGTYVPIDIFTEGARRCETATCRLFSPHRCWRSLTKGIVGMFGLKAVSPSAVELRRMYVDPDMRRRGIARMMLQAAEGECRRHSEQGLNSAPRNCRARRYSFYRSPG